MRRTCPDQPIEFELVSRQKRFEIFWISLTTTKTEEKKKEKGKKEGEGKFKRKKKKKKKKKNPFPSVFVGDQLNSIG